MSDGPVQLTASITSVLPAAVAPSSNRWLDAAFANTLHEVRRLHSLDTVTIIPYYTISLCPYLLTMRLHAICQPSRVSELLELISDLLNRMMKRSLSSSSMKHESCWYLHIHSHYHHHLGWWSYMTV
jgi:hypothetical protein